MHTQTGVSLCAKHARASHRGPRRTRRRSALVLFGLLLCAGCSALDMPLFRSQSPEEEPAKKESQGLVGDLAVPFGLHPMKIEGIALVTGLAGTGGDIPPSPQRNALIDDMQARGVDKPNTVLSSKDVSLVLVRALLRPGIQKGDRFDVEVRVPGRSETASLRGGWLMETRLREVAVLGGSLHEGHLLGLAEGPVMIDPMADARKDQIAATRGRVLGGGVALKGRDLALVLKPGHQSVFNSARIADVINKRFHTYDHGIQVGVATAETDKYVKLLIHPRYKDNVTRYFRVLRAVALQESDKDRVERIARLEEELQSPSTAADAALQLEALGKLGIEPLKRCLASNKVPVKFFAAEALAYLDQREAAEPLGKIARDEPAFRVFALTALSAMVDFGAEDQLRSMLDSPSAETRYGAFRALCAMRPNDPLTAGTRLADQFTYHVIDSSGPPMIHVAHSRRAELVLFGKGQRLTAPFVVNAGNRIVVRANGPDEVVVSRFAPNEPDQKRFVSTTVDEVVRAIVDVGGSYPDVVQALQEAKAQNALASRFEIDALPAAGRTFVASDTTSETDAPGGVAKSAPADGAASTAEEVPPIAAPDLFSKPAGSAFLDEPAKKLPADDSEHAADEQGKDKAKETKPKRGFFAKMMGSE